MNLNKKNQWIPILALAGILFFSGCINTNEQPPAPQPTTEWLFFSPQQCDSNPWQQFEETNNAHCSNQRDGTTFNSADACNQCSCENGTASCTKKLCSNKPDEKKQLENYYYQAYAVRILNYESIPAPEGKISCSACDCLRGDAIRIQVNQKDAFRLIDLGWSLESTTFSVSFSWNESQDSNGYMEKIFITPSQAFLIYGQTVENQKKTEKISLSSQETTEFNRILKNNDWSRPIPDCQPNGFCPGNAPGKTIEIQFNSTKNIVSWKNSEPVPKPWSELLQKILETRQRFSQPPILSGQAFEWLEFVPISCADPPWIQWFNDQNRQFFRAPTEIEIIKEYYQTVHQVQIADFFSLATTHGTTSLCSNIYTSKTDWVLSQATNAIMASEGWKTNGFPANNSDNQSSTGIPNPASEFCIQENGSLDNNGNCVFNSITCNEWDFYRGKCGQEFTSCKKAGFTVTNTIETMEGTTLEFGTCTINPDQNCLLNEFKDGNCPASAP